MKEELCEVTIIHQDDVDEAIKGLPKDSLIERTADFFKVFGDPTRVKILSALRGRELCVCDLACILGVSSSAVSHQLKGLRDVRLVRNRRDGKIMYYSLNDDHIEAILDMGLNHVEEV
ncbi:MAG TPA: metalloregulator ArsR/SmtB family transcription factor [Clostridiaceae bacterium]|nr:metalloregulator ArsR/SmtB family transcription factor [Clostridiaceae bacterium]